MVTAINAFGRSRNKEHVINLLSKFLSSSSWIVVIVIALWSDFLENRIVFCQLDCVLSNKCILCGKELFQTILTVLEEQRLVYIQNEELRLWTLWIGVMWAIFQESGNSPVVMHLLKNLDNQSDTMQLAIFKNLDVMSLGELLDFILRFLMRSWISYASVGVRNNAFFEFICLIKCL